MRIKCGVYTRQRKKKTLRIAKGYYSNKKNRWRMVIQQVEKSLVHAYIDRKDKKNNFRSLWILRINAAVREHGMPYNRFMSGLKNAGVIIDRKMMADMAVNDPGSFKQLVELSKSALVK